MSPNRLLSGWMIVVLAGLAAAAGIGWGPRSDAGKDSLFVLSPKGGLMPMPAIIAEIVEKLTNGTDPAALTDRERALLASIAAGRLGDADLKQLIELGIELTRERMDELAGAGLVAPLPPSSPTSGGGQLGGGTARRLPMGRGNGGAMGGPAGGGGGEDCNSNGIPDDQDIAGGTSFDCNSNTTPDECEPGGEPTSSFTATPGVPIPDFAGGVPGSATTSMTAPTGGQITDLNVGIIIPHTFQGDLIMTLTHVDTGTSRPIIFRSGDSDGVGLGYSEENFGNNGTTTEFVFDDEAADYYDRPPPDGRGNTPTPGIQDIVGSWIPYGSQPSGLDHTLMAFDGENRGGTWTLTVTDNAGIDVGTIVRWTLYFTTGFPDCNDNNTPDLCDINGGGSGDCNGNNTPDECDPVATDDCNSNGTMDVCESLADCNANQTPDVCDTAGGAGDCNGDGVPDECQLTGNDCNNNGTLDGCELTGNDCDGNGTLDSCELAGRDCDSDGSLDTCEIAAGEPDCNMNDVLDTCDLTPTVFMMVNTEPAVNGFVDLSASTSATALGLVDDGEANVTMPFTNIVFTSGDVRVGNNGGIGFNRTAGELAAGNAALPSAGLFAVGGVGAQALLPYWDNLDDEQGNVYWDVIGTTPNRAFIVQWDKRPANAGSATEETGTFQVQVFETPVNGVYAQFLYTDVDFDATANDNGLSATVGYQGSGTGPAALWSFNTANSVMAGVTLSFKATSPQDCNINGTIDGCEPTYPDCEGGSFGACVDCNGNGTLDACDIEGGQAEDCNSNGTPDECDLVPTVFSIVNDVAAVNGFIDLSMSTTATALGLVDDGEANFTLPAGFGNVLFNDPDVRIGNNGGIGFNRTSGDLAITNTALPNNAVGGIFAGAQALLPFWDDIDADQGNVYADVKGVSPNRTFIVQWHNRPAFPGSATEETGTFQVQVFETPVNGAYAQFLYQDVDFDATSNDNGASATIGYQNSGTGPIAQWSFNTPNSVAAGTVLTFVATSPFDQDHNGIPDECEMAGCPCDADVNDDGEVDGRDIECAVTCLISGGGGGCNCACVTGVTQFVNTLLDAGGPCP